MKTAVFISIEIIKKRILYKSCYTPPAFAFKKPPACKSRKRYSCKDFSRAILYDLNQEEE